MSDSQSATQLDLKNLETRIDKKFDQFGELIIGAIDGVNTNLNNKIDQFNTDLNDKIEQVNQKVDLLRSDMMSEFASIKNDIASIKERLTNLEKNSSEDSNAFGASIVELKTEIKALSQRVKNLEKQRA